MLFDPAAHEPLAGSGWSDARARAALRTIIDDTLAAFGGKRWPRHPLDDAESRVLYDSAAGVVWTLRQLQPDAAPPFDATPEADEQPSFLMGAAGRLLLAGDHDALYAVVEGNLDHPSREPLWGNPGTALAAAHAAVATGDARWAPLVRSAVQRLIDTLETDPETGTPIWTQDLYGRRTRWLGAGHGLAGNVHVALFAAPLLNAEAVATLTDVALATLTATALHGDDGMLNWHPMSDRARVAGRVPCVQDCHGASGIVNRLAGAPRTPEWDALLRGAGETTWRAGPLAKGPGLCHGTAGSALALLKLWQRFGEDRWRDRACALAHHAALQVERWRMQYGRGRPSLWTGDMGVAWLLHACLRGDARMPTIDVF